MQFKETLTLTKYMNIKDNCFGACTFVVARVGGFYSKLLNESGVSILMQCILGLHLKTAFHVGFILQTYFFLLLYANDELLHSLSQEQKFTSCESSKMINTSSFFTVPDEQYTGHEDPCLYCNPENSVTLPSSKNGCVFMN
jgi:hypothetical protein